ncbi:MAG: ChbG/HpnK family deacetylase, partial [Planctomycetaceae bacterium]|nr:ChbG/HpnK family deacetylase [Planctomycetaceae bacterium]
VWRMLASKQRDALLSQIRAEFFAQMKLMNNLAEKYRLRFDHLDSHQHIHVIPDIWRLLQTEAVRRNLPLRVPRERWGHFKRWTRRCWKWLPGGLLKQTILNVYLRKVPQEIGYFGILETGRMDKSALAAIFQSVGQSRFFDTYEINIHPSALTEKFEHEAVCCSDADKQFHASSWREKEFQTLNCEYVLRLAQQYGFVLDGFSQ